MFNLSGSEIVFLLLIALIVLGPDKLPEAVHKFGKIYGELKKMGTGFQTELKSALDEPMREMRETADAFKKAANFDFDTEGDDGVAQPEVPEPESPEPETPEPETPEPAVVHPELPSLDVVDRSPREPNVEIDEVSEAPVVRPPVPTFTSAAPHPPKVVEPAEPVEAVEETASE